MSILITQKLDIIENEIWCEDETKRKKMIKKFESDYYEIKLLINELHGKVIKR